MAINGSPNRPRKEFPPKQLVWLMPLLGFVALAGLFFAGLQEGGDPSKLPSALIGKSVPEFTLPPVSELRADGTDVPGFSSADLKKGEVSILNVWASWCGPCREEHPFLKDLKDKSKASLYGLNSKDQPERARAFLQEHGNPFKAVGADNKGRVGIDFGVYGVPETFIIDGKGLIVYKHVGPINSRIIDEKLLPAIRKARGEG